MKKIITNLLLLNILIIPFYTGSFFTYIRMTLFLLVFFLIMVDFYKNRLPRADVSYIFVFIIILLFGIVLHPYDVIVKEFQYLFSYILYPLSLYFIFLLYAKYINLNKLLDYVNYSALLSTIVGLSHYSFNASRWIVERFSGEYLDPNFYGLHILIAFIISWNRLFFEKKKIYLLFLIIYAGALVLSISKTAIILIILYLLFSLKSSLKQFIVISVLIITAVIIFIINYDFFEPVLRRFENVFHLSDHDLKSIGYGYVPGTIFGVPMDAFSNRVGLWVMSINIFIHNFISGSGLGMMLDVYKQYYVEGAIPEPSHAHNTYFHILAELGLFGAFLMFLIYKKMTKSSIKLEKDLKYMIFLYIFTITTYATPILYVVLGIFSSRRGGNKHEV